MQLGTEGSGAVMPEEVLPEARSGRGAALTLATVTLGVIMVGIDGSVVAVTNEDLTVRARGAAGAGRRLRRAAGCGLGHCGPRRAIS